MVRNLLSAIISLSLLAVMLTLLDSRLDAEDKTPSPPALPPLGTLLEGLIKDAGYPFQKVEGWDGAYWAFIKSGNDADSVYCVEHKANWNAKDGSEVRWVSLRLTVTPGYDKDVDVPDELAQSIAQTNANYNWVQYSIQFYSDKSWVVQCSADVFLRDMPSETFGYYLQLLAAAKADNKSKFIAFMTDALNPKPK